MSFLAPLFLLGALALALPILFHLIRRTTKERVPFSSLMFLEPTPPRVTRRSRLEHILLLLLRCLVLGLLALGFARPFLRLAQPPGPDAGDGAHVALLLDTSASMRREELWDQARQRAEQALRKLGPADHAALFAFDRGLRPLVSFEQWDRTEPAARAALARQALDTVKPGWGPTHLAAAITAAAEILEDEAGRGAPAGGPGPRRLVVISDFAEAAA